MQSNWGLGNILDHERRHVRQASVVQAEASIYCYFRHLEVCKTFS